MLLRNSRIHSFSEDGRHAGLSTSLMRKKMSGFRFGLRRGGRCLNADEMGLGKTLQAIALAACFIREGSILVVCPAILLYSWAEELERWFPFCLPSDIRLVFGGPDNLARFAELPKFQELWSYHTLCFAVCGVACWDKIGSA